MLLVETIEFINSKLDRQYGRAFNGQSNFRIVWSEDQFEKRWTKFTDDGLELLQAEVRFLPKYRQHIHEKYVLERYIPIIGETDLTVKVNYEPCWVFHNGKGEYIPPRYDMCTVIIDSILEAAGRKSGFKKYVDPTTSPEYRKQQIEKMQEELFGNETETGDSLAYKEGVTVPSVSQIETVAEETKATKQEGQE